MRPVPRFDRQCALTTLFPTRSEQVAEWILKQVQDDVKGEEVSHLPKSGYSARSAAKTTTPTFQLID
ncbi:hypothetical protein EDF56_105318 [Novosphingobium sp. PhB165]|nr:hypothetical protein EDF56_105318 [Novosphingobium sp. PhB165]